MKKFKTLIIAGGTGGHIFPGLGLYQQFEKEQPNQTVFLSIPRNKNYKEFNNIHIYFYHAPKIAKTLKDLFLFLPLFFYGFFEALNIILKEKIDVIIGLGGYPSVPAIMAGIFLRRTIYLCEQNVIPGKVTILFSRFAKKIFFTFPPEDKYQLKFKNKIVLTGNPFRENLFLRAKKGKKKNQIPSTIFITGGSQGALQLNEMAIKLWHKYPDFSKKYNWILQTGKDHFSKYSQEIKKLTFANKIECFDFSNDIYQYFEKSDILICRAGAGNISEGILFSLPMILIPYPYATDNHQEANAKFVEKMGCGEIISSKSTEPELLIEKLKMLIKNYKFYKENLKEINFKSNPAKIIFQQINID